MEKNLFIVVVLVLLSFAVIEGVGWIFSCQPGYVQIDRESTYVGTDTEQFVVLRGSTLYTVISGEVVSGCYRLTEPTQPGGRGTAELAWPHCQKPGSNGNEKLSTR